MSVISRMLRDLEAREARPASPREADDRPRHFPAGAPPRRRRRARSRLHQLASALLALGLLAVAAALWWQRGPELRALVAPVPEPAAEPAVEAEPAAGLRLDPPRLAQVRFTGSGREAALELALEGEPAEQPGYARRGGTLAVRVPAPIEGLRMPAPPDDQRVFRSATLQSDDAGRATIRLQVAEGASFDLRRDAGTLVVLGRVPAAPDPQSSAAAQEPDADAADPVAPPEDAPSGPATQQASGAGAAPGDTAAAAAGVDEAPSTSGEPPAETSPATNDTSGENTGGEKGDAGSVRKDDRSSPEVRAHRRYRDARAALSQGELGRARRLLRGALSLDGGLHGARDLLVALHRRVGDTDAARDVLAEGIERAPERLAYAKPLARLLVDTGELERAAAVLEGAATAGREDADYHALAAAVAQRRGRYEQAAAAYTRALELDGANGRWWLGLGVSLEAAGMPGEAAAAFREARRTGTLSQRLDEWTRSRIGALGERSD